MVSRATSLVLWLSMAAGVGGGNEIYGARPRLTGMQIFYLSAWFPRQTTKRVKGTRRITRARYHPRHAVLKCNIYVKNPEFDTRTLLSSAYPICIHDEFFKTPTPVGFAPTRLEYFFSRQIGLENNPSLASNFFHFLFLLGKRTMPNLFGHLNFCNGRYTSELRRTIIMYFLSFVFNWNTWIACGPS